MKKSIEYKIALVICFIMFFPIVSFADNDLVVPEYTEEYKQWMELTDEEKEGLIEQQPFKFYQEKENEDNENTEESITDEEIENEIQSLSINSNMDTLSASALDPSFCRDDYGSVKNQGGYNSCWAFSAATVFETNYNKIKKSSVRKTFSNLHMDYITSNLNSKGFYRGFSTDGNMLVALAYATNGMGIASDTTVNASNFQSIKPVAKVSDYIELTTRTQIKNYIVNYGVVSCSTYFSGTDAYKGFSTTDMSDDNLAYCWTDSTTNADHAVTLIGWDDTYTATINGTTHTGAYIALNSHGTSFGNNGTYHIMYDDVFVQKELYGVTKTDDIDYDYLYQHDEYGCVGSGGYSETSYVANVFSRTLSNYTEKLKEISFYAPKSGTVTIYINANNTDLKPSSATKTITTYISQPGYHTIEFDSPIEIKNSKFVVGVKVNGPIGVEANAGSYWSNVKSNAGESYISPNGTNFYDMKTIYASTYPNINACIKAFTDKGSAMATSTTTTTKKNEYTADLANYVFNYKYYADHNPDLFVAFGYNESALRNHWNAFGKAEGRASSPIFNVSYYVENNSDLKKAFGTNYVAAYNHFMSFGYSEYRKSSLEYNGSYYKNNNSDLKNMTSMELIRHYSNFGRNELRRANTTYDVTDYMFDINVYAACNADVVAVFGKNETALKRHWFQFGIREGRTASLIFDSKYYLNNNSDIVKAYGRNYYSAYMHFIGYGFNESRQGSKFFLAKYYLDNNTDLKTAYGSNYYLGVRHFISNGVKEGRTASSTFNVVAYRLKNSDLRKAFGENYMNYFMHYISFGQYENRKCL